MKKMTVDGIETTYHNPVFEQSEVENVIHTRDVIDWTNDPKSGKRIPVYGEWRTERTKRKVTLCQVEMPTYIFHENGEKELLAMNTRIGVSIMNPDDKEGELGNTISEGRAIKNPVNTVTMVTPRRLPKAVRKEQIQWAIKHVERNLDNYVNNIRETLKS